MHITEMSINRRRVSKCTETLDAYILLPIVFVVYMPCQSQVSSQLEAPQLDSRFKFPRVVKPTLLQPCTPQKKVGSRSLRFSMALISGPRRRNESTGGVGMSLGSSMYAG